VLAIAGSTVQREVLGNSVPPWPCQTARSIYVANDDAAHARSLMRLMGKGLRGSARRLRGELAGLTL